MAEDTKEVLKYRLERQKNGPSNWLLWVAFFCAFNAIFINDNVQILAGITFAYNFVGSIPHFVAAAIFVIFGFLGRSGKKMAVLVGVVSYALDAAYTAYIGYWSGLFMHVFILVLMAISFFIGESLKKKIDAIESA